MLYCILGWTLAVAIFLGGTLIFVKLAGWKITAFAYLTTGAIVGLITLSAVLIQHCPKC